MYTNRVYLAISNAYPKLVCVQRACVFDRWGQGNDGVRAMAHVLEKERDGGRGWMVKGVTATSL